MKSLYQFIIESESDIILTDYEGRDQIRPFIKEIWEIMSRSYGGKVIGGSTPKNLLRNADRVTVASDSGRIIAAEVFRIAPDNTAAFKGAHIGSDGSETGKLAMQAIIKRNIESNDIRYWAEVSGAIEHWYKKHKGYPVPNIFAEELLGKTVILDDDEFHYTRIIGEDEIPLRKIIFGFATEDLARRAVDGFADYLLKRKKIITERLAGADRAKNAAEFIGYLYEWHDNGLGEIPQSVHDELRNAAIALDGIDGWSRVSERAEYLLDTLEIIKIHSAEELAKL